MSIENFFQVIGTGKKTPREATQKETVERKQKNKGKQRKGKKGGRGLSKSSAYLATFKEILEKGRRKNKTKEEIILVDEYQRRLCSHQFMSCLCFLLDVVEVEGKATVWTELHGFDLISTRF